jgi:hypothetical protein
VIPRIGTDVMLLIAAIRRRGVETVVDRSCFFVFLRLCLAGSERGTVRGVVCLCILCGGQSE